MDGLNSLLVAAGLLAATGAGAAGLELLVQGERICDARGVVCLDATITWEPNPRLLELRGRVAATAPPGELVIVFLGHQRDGTVRHAEMRIPLEGHYSEIVRDKMIPDWPDVADWAFDHALFEPRTKDHGRTR